MCISILLVKMAKGGKVYANKYNRSGGTNKYGISIKTKLSAKIDINKQGFVRCDICNLTFSLVNEFLYHLRRCTTNEKRCSDCGSNVTDNSELGYKKCTHS